MKQISTDGNEAKFRRGDERLAKKKYEELTITNDFIFAKVMLNNLKLCKKLLELILGVKIKRIEIHEGQKSLDVGADSHGVRFDVYVDDDEGTVYDIEMQTTNPGNIPKRTRYYQGVLDISILESGMDYKELRKSFIIFICLEDIFGKGRYVYRFRNLCTADPKIELGDETEKVFVSPRGDDDVEEIGEELKNFLRYLAEGVIGDDYTRELDDAVEFAKKNAEWRREYMTLEMKLRDSYEEGERVGEERGIERGREQGRAEGFTAIYKLVGNKLLPISEALKALGISEKEFDEKAKRYGLR